MDLTACTEPQCLYNGALYLFLPMVWVTKASRLDSRQEVYFYLRQKVQTLSGNQSAYYSVDVRSRCPRGIQLTCGLLPESRNGVTVTPIPSITSWRAQNKICYICIKFIFSDTNVSPQPNHQPLHSSHLHFERQRIS